MSIFVNANDLDMSDTYHAGLRAVLIDFTGKDGKTAKVTFDRYAPGFFVSVNQMVSNALASVIRLKGADWVEGYTVRGLRETR